MKVLERIVDGLIRQLVSTDYSQFGFVPGRGTTDTIFVVRQLQEKYLAANKKLYLAYIDLEKAFDPSASEDHLVRRKFGTEEWNVWLVQGMYANARSCVSVREGYSEEFEMEGQCSSMLGTQPAVLHHYMCLKPCHVSSGSPLGGPLCRRPCYHCWIAQGICQEALDLERSNRGEQTESKCRKDEDHDLWYGPGPLAEFSDSIFCNGCTHLVHKKCSGLKHLTKDPDYRCTRCQGTACPMNGRPQMQVQVGPDKLKVVTSFCYLGDMLSAAGGCELLITTHVKTAWKKFKELLPILSSSHFSFKTHGYMYNFCVKSAMLYASETWPLTKPNLQRLQRNARAMIRQICNVKRQDIVTTRSNELHVLA